MVDHEERYDNQLKPAIENLDKDPFYSSDLSESVGYPPQAISHTLRAIADTEDREIELIDSFPYLFTAEGNNPEDYQEEEEPTFDEENESDETDERLEEVYDILQAEGELSETEARQEIINQIEDTLDDTARLERQGALFDGLKSYKDATYIPEEKKFTVKG